MDLYGIVSYSTHVDLTTDSGEMVHMAMSKTAECGIEQTTSLVRAT